MLKGIFNKQSKTITSAAIVIGAASLVSRLLGVLRDRVLAGEFGADIQLDMYYAAFRLPDLIFNLLVIGAISAGFIPVFTAYLDNKKEAWRLVNIVLNFLLILLALISALLVFIAPWLIKIVAPGFTPEQIIVTANLSRIMFLSPLFFAISGILSGVLQTFKRFFIYSLAPIMYNVGIIIGALYFVPVLGIYGLAWGVVFGAFMHMTIQIPSVFVLGYNYRPILDFKHKGLIKIIKVMVPRIMGIITVQINFFIITIIGSTLAAGTITIFNLANNLQSFPLGIFAVPFAIAAFPTLAALVKNKESFVKTFSQSLRQILFLIIPASAMLIILRAQIVRIVLGSGRFNWEDTVLTLNTLSFFAVSLFAQAAILLLARAFYAHDDSKTPFFAGLVSAFANIILALILVEYMDVAGLAFAFSLANILNFVLLWILLHNKIGSLDGKRTAISAGKILIATFIMSLVAQAAKYIAQPSFGTQTFVGVTLQALLAIFTGLGVYILVCRLLKSEELNDFITSMGRKFGKKVTPPVEAMEVD